MTVSAALPKNLKDQDGIILTFVIPAPDGCNLNCPFCIIKQRNENAIIPTISAYNYYKFILETAHSEDISAICIQGYEPLLSASFEYMWSILKAGRRLNVPTSVVTNGVRLAESTQELKLLKPDKIAVSLDASTPDEHDRQRGGKGAWAATVSALKYAVPILSSSTELVVSSVLIPKKREQLEGMPALLKGIGISHWVINPLIKVGKNDAGGAVGNHAAIFQDLLALKRKANRHGIDLTVDDEFGGLQTTELPCDAIDISALHINRLQNPSNLFRLLPTGQCSVGIDILKQSSNEDNVPVWMPDSNAADFLAAMRTA